MLSWIADLGTFSITDVPGGRSVFGPFEPFIPLFSPFFGDEPPTEEELEDALIDAGSSVAPIGSGGLAGPAFSKGKENVRDYNKKTDVLDDILSKKTRGEVQSDD
jgi:hypothetical protein